MSDVDRSSPDMEISDSSTINVGGAEAQSSTPKLTARARQLLGEQVELELEIGDREIGTALELLLEWYDRSCEASK